MAARGMTSGDVASKLGVDVSVIYQRLKRWRAGTTYGPTHQKVLQSMAQALEVPAGILLGLHTIRFEGALEGDGIEAVCLDCPETYHLSAGHTAPQLSRFELNHWGVPA